MLTIKEAFIELGDCNTSLIHLGSSPPSGPLRLSTGGEYQSLYQKVASGPREYADLTGQQTGAVLQRLKPAYHANKYWSRYFNSSEVDTYGDFAWERLVPLEALLNFKLTASPGDVAQVRVSPVPRVLLYPFGWSTWISLRILGELSLPTLAALLRRFHHEAAYTLVPGGPALTCAQVFQQVGKGVWTDAFGGGKKTSSATLDVLTVTSVLEKFGGSPALGALDQDPDLEAALAALVSPDQPEADTLSPEVVHELPQGDKNFDFLLQKGSSFFLWVDHRLKAEGQNRKRLHCYHNNTILSLLHAWQLTSFLNQARRSKDNPAALKELVATGVEQIEQQLAKLEGYRNYPLLHYLQRDNVKEILTKTRQAFDL